VRYTEINLFGVYIAPIAPMIVAAWVCLIPLRRLAERFGLLRYVWHPALFLFSVFLVLLSAIVLLVGRVAS
jgi:protein AaeX